ncbi:hypothetical protein ELK40_12260 [Enterobacter sp. N18-03635]|nr:hypothetical protein ELK40_12260 [Enterobacter sp. N18-03635]
MDGIMEKSQYTYAARLINLLQKKRDGLILFDGRWGSGKTYFFKNYFKNLYDTKTLFYISLMGVKSLEEFKSKLIESYHLRNSKDLKTTLESISGILSVASGTPASANVINGIFNAIGSSIRENILSTLDGLFVLDDIERINDSNTRSEILNYCHSLYTSSDSHAIDFIIITNTNKESQIEIANKEKIISDNILYIPTIHDILSINVIEDNLSRIPEQDRHDFSDLLKRHSVINIRLIQRIIDKMLPLYEYSAAHPNLNWKLPSTELLNSIFSFFILHYSHEVTLEDIENSSYFRSANISTDTPHLIKELWNGLNSYRIPNIAKQYYLGYISPLDFFEHVFSQHTMLTARQIIESNYPQQYNTNEKDFNEYIYAIVSRKVHTDLNHWLQVLTTYKRLSQGSYVLSYKQFTPDYIVAKSDEFSIEEIKCYYIETQGVSYIEDVNPGSEPSEQPLRQIYSRFVKYRHNVIINKIHTLLIQEGWSKFDITLLKKLKPQGLYQSIELLGADFLTTCILRNWTPNDILSFNAYLVDLYNFSNIQDYLSGEKTHLIDIKNKMNLYLAFPKATFKYGAIKELGNTINDIVVRLSIKKLNNDEL